MRFKLIIAYDGTYYCGWQVQANAQSIQTLIQRSLETVLRHPVNLTGAGRTDAGVHATGQTAHFDSDRDADPYRLRYSLNALLPSDIRIVAIEPEASCFHARYSAVGKVYHYHLHLGPVADPITRLYQTLVHGPFDKEAVKQAAKQFIGKHDFIAFANESHKGAAAHDSIRTLYRLDVVEQPGGLRLEFEGNGFLYKMVRNITGTLLDVAMQRRDPQEIKGLLQQKERCQSGPTAPAQGLFLVKVQYENNEGSRVRAEGLDVFAR
jgi:tRNA pseudouridine38-40 synthase